MFENLAERLQNTFAKLTGKGKLSEKDIDQAMREIRLALLEADVNYKVVKDFVKDVKEKSMGESVMKSLTPGQMVIKIVRDRMVDLMTDDNRELRYASPSTIILMCGLQGSGKTTHAAKLANYYIKKGKRPLLVACDVYRPAAISQLQILGKKVGADVYQRGTEVSPVTIAKDAVEMANRSGYNVVIIDTAGRLQIDEKLMEELKSIKESVNVTETLLVVDAMTGQEAVNVAKTFNDDIDISGIILSKMDGDARGGAALSIRAVTGKPIKLVGQGEKIDDLAEFYPDRLVSRILGMGDVLSLIEKAEQNLDQEKAREMEEKLRKAKFDLNDFYDQLQQVKRMGPLQDILSMLPGMNKKAMAGINIDDKQMIRVEAILTSMTDEERKNPDLINGSRRERIAKGSGTSPVMVNRLLKQFRQSKKMMKKLSNMGSRRNPFKGFF